MAYITLDDITGLMNDSLDMDMDVNALEAMLTDEDETIAFMEFAFENYSTEDLKTIMREGESLALHGLVNDAAVCEAVLEYLEQSDASRLDETEIDLEEDEDDMFGMEATKRVVIKDWKATNFSRQEKRNCMSIAKANNDPNVEKALMYKKKYLEFRAKVYARWMSKAKAVTKKQMQANRMKASNMKTPVGHSITDRIDKTIKAVDKNGRNHKAIKN